MNWGYVTVIAIVFSLLMILAQRIVQRHQRMFYGFVISMAVLLMIRYEQKTENLIAYAVALTVSFLFWLLIGRYNKVGNADEEQIKVYGLDD